MWYLRFVYTEIHYNKEYGKIYIEDITHHNSGNIWSKGQTDRTPKIDLVRHPFILC